MKMKGSRVQKLLIKEIKVATAEPLTQLGATLSPEPCVMAWGAHAFPDQGSNLGPLLWEHGVSATGPPEKSLT